MTKILLVEDDKSLREIYGVRLLAEGYDIISAGDGEEALAMAIKERPALIVSDVMMPKISGFDMLDILRSTTETKEIKVIMMTALSSEDQRARGEALGADRYLVKSQVGIEDVVRTVHDVLGDAPVTGQSAADMFGGAAAPATTRPAPGFTPPPRPSQMPEPQPQSAPAPAPTPAPAAPQPAPTPSAPFQTAPLHQSATPAAPAPSSLPQPTAPFSTNRPANLGDRIIHPITPAPGQGPHPDIANLMEQELNSAAPAPAAPTPPPEPTPAPAAPQPSAPVQLPEPPTIAPPAATPGPQPAPSTPEDSGISFEETPRTPGPQPPATNNPQPPTT